MVEVLHMVVELVHTLEPVQDMDGLLERVLVVEQVQHMDGRLEKVPAVDKVQHMGDLLAQLWAVQKVRDMDILLVHLLAEEQAHKLGEVQLLVGLCFEWVRQQVERNFEYKVAVPEKDKGKVVAPAHRTGTSWVVDMVVMSREIRKHQTYSLFF
jgi:hypothetical protein